MERFLVWATPTPGTLIVENEEWANLDGLTEETLAEHLSVDEVTWSEDAMGAAGGGSE